MEFLNIRELRHDTPSVLKRVQHGEKIVITNHGKPQAILLQLSEDEIEDLVFKQPEFLKEIEASRAEHRKKGGISLSSAKKKLGL